MATGDGVRVAGVCYPATQGYAVWFSRAPSSVASYDGTIVTSYYGPDSGSSSGWALFRSSVTDGVETVTYVPVGLPNLEVCDSTGSFFDGVSVGWLIVAALVAVGAFRVMRRGVLEV